MINTDRFPWKKITLTHWDWTFVILFVGGGALASRYFLASFSVKKMSPSPSNAWLPKPPTILMAFCVDCEMSLLGPVLEVGPHNLSTPFGPFNFHAVNLGNDFYHCYI
jgi:hypothetical protein